MAAIDYLLADPVLIPRESRPLFVETVHDLPGFMPFAPPADSPAPTPLPADRNGFVTFGSMNRLTKINDRVLQVWAEVLARMPQVRLLMKDPALDEAAARERVLSHFRAHGIDADRIVLRGKTSRREHLATYGEIDIALDPFPQSGGVTTFESLWMGVPVITLLGERPQGRASASILIGVGLADAIATTPDDYVMKAVEWAGDRDRLGAMRAALRGRLRDSPFCDHRTYARAVEAAYRQFWRRWCRSR
jgi:predicted O-linked N-acetylglucosamine transferase (SPINDLY family)